MLFCIHNTLRLFRPREVAPHSTLVLRESPIHISSDAGIQRTILAFQNVDEVLHCLFKTAFKNFEQLREGAEAVVGSEVSGVGDSNNLGAKSRFKISFCFFIRNVWVIV